MGGLQAGKVKRKIIGIGNELRLYVFYDGWFFKYKPRSVKITCEYINFVINICVSINIS